MGDYGWGWRAFSEQSLFVPSNGKLHQLRVYGVGFGELVLDFLTDQLIGVVVARLGDGFSHSIDLVTDILGDELVADECGCGGDDHTKTECGDDTSTSFSS